MKASMTAILATALALLLASCAMDMGQGARYGAYGGPARERQPEPPFSIEDTRFGVRWFPTHVRYAPDSTHLLVSLCHTLRPSLCRIGKYHIESRAWEILPYEDKRTYRWPVYHPSGKEIAVSTGPCDEQYRCALNDYALVRMRPDGTRFEQVADVTAKEMHFSPDGKKLIYWRLGGISVRGRQMASANIYEMEWPSGRERELMYVSPAQDSPEGRVFFVDGGQAFIYFGHTTGPQYAMHYVHLKDVPITAYDRHKITRLWPQDGPDWRNGGSFRVYDVGPENRLLYLADLALRRAGGDDAVRVKDPLYNDSAYFLLRARSEPTDKAAYKKPRWEGGYDAAIAPDVGRVAYLDGSPVSYHPTHKGLALVEQGDKQPTYIAWPKLELKPGRQAVSQQH